MMKRGKNNTMKTIIAREVGKVQELADKSGLPDPEKEELVNIVKRMAYQWCLANASSCAMESAIQQLYPDIDRSLVMQATIHSDVQMRKMQETYPFGTPV